MECEICKKTVPETYKAARPDRMGLLCRECLIRWLTRKTGYELVRKKREVVGKSLYFRVVKITPLRERGAQFYGCIPHFLRKAGSQIKLAKNDLIRGRTLGDRGLANTRVAAGNQWVRVDLNCAKMKKSLSVVFF